MRRTHSIERHQTFNARTGLLFRQVTVIDCGCQQTGDSCALASRPGRRLLSLWRQVQAFGTPLAHQIALPHPSFRGLTQTIAFTDFDKSISSELENHNLSIVQDVFIAKR